MNRLPSILMLLASFKVPSGAAWTSVTTALTPSFSACHSNKGSLLLASPFRQTPCFARRKAGRSSSSSYLSRRSVHLVEDVDEAMVETLATPPSLSKSSSSSSSSVKNPVVLEALPSSSLAIEETTTAAEPDYHILAQKIANGLILALSFGYAAYTILNIDHGMTRGWTQSEIAMRIPLDNWNNYESSLAEKPMYTKTLINVVIYLLGDWLSQTVFTGKNILDFDAWRVLRNGFIGLCFGPLVHEYYQFSDHILPVEGGLMNRLEKILMDQTIYLTVKCSMYIMAVGLLQGQDFDTVKTTVKDRIGGIVITAWKFWPLVHCITYGVIPARHRILWVNSVDLVWNAILASMSQKKTDDDDTEENVVAEESSNTAVMLGEKEGSSSILENHQEELTSDPFLLKQDVILPSDLAAVESTTLFKDDDTDALHSPAINTTLDVAK